MKLNIRLWLQTVNSKKYNHLMGRFKLLGERLLTDHIKVVANDDTDLNAGLGKDLDDFVDWLDYMFKFTGKEKENNAMVYKTS